MDIINRIVRHKAWGQGMVLSLNGDIIEIRFDIGDKKIKFPDSFEKLATFEDDEVQAYVLSLLLDKRDETERLLLERHEKHEAEKLMKTREASSSPRIRKTIEKANIAFKCNFCDGGCSKSNIGYMGVCSDEMIDYNIEVAHHSWCSNSESPCFKYYCGDMTRDELEDFMAGGVQDAGYVCYESQMLINWKAFAGYALTKENYQRPMTLPKVKTNSLCILTTRLPGSSEKDRLIFAVFLVDETFEGDNRSEGYVTTSSKFRLSFSMDEAKKLKFWNYYFNVNNPESIAWGQGLHRYIDDVQAAQILRDAVTIKKGTKEEKPAEEFYEYFLKINGFDKDYLPPKRGALSKA